MTRSSPGCGRPCPATSPRRCGGCGRRTWPGCPGGCWRSGRAPAPTSSSTRRPSTRSSPSNPSGGWRRWPARPATTAPVPVTVSTDTVEDFRRVSRSTRWCARWCCVRSKNQIVFCGNCFRCCVRVANCATSNMSPAPASGAAAEARRRDGVAAAAGQLPHPTAHRGAIVGAGFPGAAAPVAMGASGLGPLPVSEFAIGRAVKPRLARRRAQHGVRAASLSKQAGALQQAAAPAAVSRSVTVALSDSGVRSGLTSTTTVPLASASSGSPAAG